MNTKQPFGSLARHHLKGWSTALTAMMAMTATASHAAWPSFDPSNSQGWIVNNTYTDEFNGSSLDTAKWHDTNVGWIWGRAPGIWDPGNISVSGGTLKMKTIEVSLLTNGSFEQNTTSPPTGWTTTGGGTTVSISSVGGSPTVKEFHRWTRGLKLTNGTGGVQQVVTGLSPNTQYKLSAHVRRGTAPSITVGVRNYGGSVQQTTRTETAWPVQTSTPGCNVVIWFTTGATNTTAEVFINNGGTGTSFADEVSVCPRYLPTGLELHNDFHFTTSNVQSKTPTTAGYYEARMKVANGSHTSSFWFSASGGWSEIDVVENVGNSTADPSKNQKVPTNSHYYYGGWPNDIATPYVYNAGHNLRDAFRIFGVQWDYTAVIYYYGSGSTAVPITYIARPTNYGQNPAWPAFQMEQLLIFNTETQPHAGRPLDNLNSTLEVDYVRAWNKPLCHSAVYVIKAMHNTSLVMTAAGTSSGSDVRADSLFWGFPMSQRWMAVDTGNGTYRLTPQNAPTMALEAQGTSAGSNVRIVTYTGANSQKWAMVPFGQPIGKICKYELLPVSAGMSGIRAEVPGSGGSGTSIKMGNTAGQNQARWHIERIEDVQ